MVMDCRRGLGVRRERESPCPVPGARLEEQQPCECVDRGLKTFDPSGGLLGSHLVSALQCNMCQLRCLSLLVLVFCSSACGDDDPGTDGSPGDDLFPTYWDTGGTCSSNTCAGCCSGTLCVLVPYDQACGYGGAPCQACLSTQTCKDGACVTPSVCDATSCSGGCCSQGQCQSGTQDSACGTGGAACQSCESGKVCVGQTCITKGSGSYQVLLVSLLIKDSWLVCGWSGLYPETKCDPYVEISVGSTTKTSSTKADTHTPVWNEPLLTASETDLTGQVVIKVKDEDTGPDETIGTCYPKITSADLSAGKKVDNCGADVTDLTLEFKPN